MEACEILFGDQARQKYLEYFPESSMERHAKSHPTTSDAA